MKPSWLIAGACGLLLLAGCEPIEIGLGDDASPPAATRASAAGERRRPPPGVLAIDLPAAMRVYNYGGGSCLHAAWEDALLWQHQERVASHWRHNHGGPARVEDIARLADLLGLDYAYTDSGNVAFLEWCSRTRRGAAIHWIRGTHAILFCGFEGDQAILIGTNDPAITRMPRESFLKEWVAAGGCAITPLYSPTPPHPWT
jgi:hypothetical protein